jgi:hypothetical protein
MSRSRPERDGQVFLVGAVHDLADAVILDRAQVFEHEHQIRIDTAMSGASVSIRPSRLADAAIEPIEELGHDAPPHRCSRSGRQTLEPLVDDAGDLAIIGEISSMLAIRIRTSARMSSAAE